MERNLEVFESLLHVGLLSQLNAFPTRHETTRSPVVLRGWQKGGYILLEALSGHHLPHLPKHHACTVCFMSAGRACGFDTDVLGWERNEVSQIRVSWPTQVEVLTMRRFERIETNLPCELTFPDGSTASGLVSDLSVGGCGVHCSDISEAKISAILELAVDFPNGSRIEKLRILVRSRRPAAGSTALGCEFLDLGETDRQDIMLFVSTTLALRRDPRHVCSAILLLEDRVDVAHELMLRLEKRECNVVVVRSLVDAFYRLRTVLPCAFVLRSETAVLDVVQVCRMVKETRGMESLPLFVYGAGDLAVAKNVLQVGAMEHFPASATPDDIVDGILAHLTCLYSASGHTWNENCPHARAAAQT